MEATHNRVCIVTIFAMGAKVSIKSICFVSFNTPICFILDSKNPLSIDALFPEGREVRIQVPFCSKAFNSFHMADCHFGRETASENFVGSTSAVTDARNYQGESEIL